jgi:ribosomal protein L33
MDPNPASRRCSYCGSYQITEKREENDDRVSLKVYCNACRRGVVFFEGTLAEERIFKRKRRVVKKKLKRR